MNNPRGVETAKNFIRLLYRKLYSKEDQRLLSEIEEEDLKKMYSFITGGGI